MINTLPWHRDCPVCGKDNEKICFENRLAILDGIDMSYAITVCENCGFNYAADLPTPQQYEQYYQSLSKYDVALESSPIPEVDSYRAEAAVKFVSPYINKSDSILDVGCGSGILLNAFKKSGWNKLYGVDPAPNATEQARKNFDLECVQTGRLSDVSMITQVTDINVVCLMGVLEHLPRLAEDLSFLLKPCHENLQVLIEVPASERFISDDFEPFGEFSIEHIQFFSMASLNRLMERYEFYPVKTAYLDLPLGTTDSLLCLYSQRKISSDDNILSNSVKNDLNQYIIESEKRLQRALFKIKASVDSIIIYGAGSHSVRLLPYLTERGLSPKIIAIVDNNPNLLGKSLSGFEIQHPDEVLHRNPRATVLVSSYRSQQPIADSLSLRCSNPVLTIY